MDNELTKKVIEWIEVSAQKIGDFAISEIPPFIHEYLTWKFWEAGIEAFMLIIYPLIVLICLIKFGRKTIKWTIDEMDDSSGASVFLTLAVGAVVIVPAVLMLPLTQIKDMVQIKIAPKVYLIEKAAEMLKDKN